jgi:hypothetical protein
MSTTAQGKAFEQRVAHLFSLLGYSVRQDELLAGRQVDLVLADQRGPILRQYIVECKDQSTPVTTAQYDSFRGRLSAAKQVLGVKLQGIIVSSVGFVKEAKAQSQHDQIDLITVSELQRSLIDFQAHIHHTIAALETDQSLHHFIEPKLRKEGGELSLDAADLLADWLKDPAANQLTVLGDYGTGKSTLLKQLCLQFAVNYQNSLIDSGQFARVPVFIDLRDYTTAVSLRQIILSFLDSLQAPGASYAAFEYLLRQGHILLFLDSFDEMASRGNAQVTLRNFRELNKAATGRSKIILACRTHYFTTQDDVHRVHGSVSRTHELPATHTDLYREIVARPNFLIAHLVEFDRGRVDRYLESRCGREWIRVRSFIDSKYDLKSLSRRPVLLDMIVSSHGRLVEHQVDVSPWTLYETYTDIWLAQNDWCSLLTVQTKSLLLERFAHRVRAESTARIHYSELRELISTWQPVSNDVDAQEIDRELRTASFLDRTDDGFYGFSHRSIFEFFYARCLLTACKSGRDSDWSEGHFDTEVYHFLRDVVRDDAAVRDALVRWVEDESYSEFTRSNAIKCLGGIDDPKTVSVLSGALQTAQGERVRASAATALGAAGAEQAVDALILAATADSSIFVRSNATVALAMVDDDRAESIVRAALKGPQSSKDRPSVIRQHVYGRLSLTTNDALVQFAIREAPIQHVRVATVSACLDLCKRWPSTVSQQYCERVASTTASPLLTARALSQLPPAARQRYVSRVIALLQEQKRGGARRELLRCLSEIDDPRVGPFLVKTIDRSLTERGELNAAPQPPRARQPRIPDPLERERDRPPAAAHPTPPAPHESLARSPSSTAYGQTP